MFARFFGPPIKSEEALLETLTERGFDFRSSVDELARRHGERDDYGLAGHPYVTFTPSQPFANLSGEWKIHINGPLDRVLPATYYSLEHHPFGQDARKNHADALTKLQALLGDGTDESVSNTWGRTWQLGFFKVRVTTWPAHLNDRHGNVYNKVNPHLFASANVAIEVPFPCIDRRADYAIAAARAARQQFNPAQNVLQWSSAFNVYAERNSQSLEQSFGDAEVLTWFESESAPSALMLAQADRTARIPPADWVSLSLLRMEPARFSGYATLQLKCRFRGVHEINGAILTGETFDALDRIAPSIAKQFGLPLSIETDQDVS